MAEKKRKNGSCLCGSIQFTASNVNVHVGACHCGMCRKWGGGPLMAVDCGSEVSFENSHNITVYDSSDWAERGFCKNCGSHLFYRLKQSQQYHIPVGLFENNEEFIFDHQVFIDKKPAFYSFANSTTDMTEAELFAKYDPPT